jgi:hypothetical protein
LNGINEIDFWTKLETYPGWNTGIYCLFINDCHVEAQEACEYAGGAFPKWPTGRVDYDDNIMGHIFSHFSSYINSLISSAMEQW